jgi:transposase
MLKPGRPKGGVNRYWSKEDKYSVIKPVIEGKATFRETIKISKICRGQLAIWLKRYYESGICGLENKRKPGNPIAALNTSKTLTEVERMRLELMKKDIEIQRLKKGYTKKEVDQAREKLSRKNTK